MVAVVWKAASFFQEHVATRPWKEDPTKIPEIPGEDHAELAVVVVAPPAVSPAISGRTPRSRAHQRSRPARPRRLAIASSSKRSCSGKPKSITVIKPNRHHPSLRRRGRLKFPRKNSRRSQGSAILASAAVRSTLIGALVTNARTSIFACSVGVIAPVTEKAEGLRQSRRLRARRRSTSVPGEISG